MEHNVCFEMNSHRANCWMSDEFLIACFVSNPLLSFPSTFHSTIERARYLHNMSKFEPNYLCLY